MKDLNLLSYPDHTLAIAAFDHRNSLYALINPQAPDEVPDHLVVGLKRLFIKAFADISSAILIDPVYGLDYGLDLTKEVPENTGILMSLEESSYDESAEGRITHLLPHWGVSDIKAHHAAAKLLLYYHPDAPIAADQLKLVESISKQCRDQQTIFLIEPILYGLDEYSHKDKLSLTLKTIDQLSPLVDILKLEFPLDVARTTTSDWRHTSQEITRHATVPWILLSRGMGFDHFKRLTQLTCETGASGIAVGRAVWQEIADVSKKFYDHPEELLPALEEFLMTTARVRMRELVDLVHQTAKPWTKFQS